MTKRFPGTTAVAFDRGQRLDFLAGEIHAVVGENGAGKSTLGALIAGVHPPTAGQMLVDGVEYRPTDILHARREGVALVPQESFLVPNMTVAENITLGLPRVAWHGFIVPSRRDTFSNSALQLAQNDIDSSLIAGELSREDQKLVEFCRALQYQPRVLIVDEMTEALSRPRVDELFAALGRFVASGGLVLYVSHRLEEIFEICNRVTVMKDGVPVATLSVPETNEEELSSLMIGRSLTIRRGHRARAQRAPGSYRYVCEGATSEPYFRNVSFGAEEGEIVGIGGLVGCGKERLVRVLVGDEPLRSGQIRLGGKTVELSTPRAAIKAGIAYVPGERDRDGLILSLDVRRNITLASEDSFAIAGFTRPQREKGTVAKILKRLDVKTRGAWEQPLYLSGGNRQKVVLAKWLIRSNKLLILENPTHGVDVGAKAEVYRFVSEIAEGGLPVVLVSDELNELLTVADRILVMRRGEVVFETPAASADEEILIRYML